MKHTYNDGGRAAAGYKGQTGDCTVRAIAICMQRPYQEVYDEINEWAKRQRKSKKRTGNSSSREGIYSPTIRRYMASKGWEWVSTMGIGTGCTVHLRETELPSGRIMVNVSKHITSVIDGVIHDIYNPDRDGSRCVYGYWTEPK